MQITKGYKNRNFCEICIQDKKVRICLFFAQKVQYTHNGGPDKQTFIKQQAFYKLLL